MSSIIHKSRLSGGSSSISGRLLRGFRMSLRSRLRESDESGPVSLFDGSSLTSDVDPSSVRFDCPVMLTSVENVGWGWDRTPMRPLE